MQKIERRRGRPAAGRQVVIRMPEALIAALDKAAGREGVSRPEMVRRLLTSTAVERELKRRERQ